MDPRGACVNCGTPLAGRYCHACGERDAAERELSLRAFLREHTRTLFELRGKGLRSFGALLLLPGALTAEYVRGRRVRYLHPLQLFLLANLLFFVTVPITGVGVLSSSLRDQLDRQAHSNLVRDALRDRFTAEDTVVFETFEARFNILSEVQARSLVIIMVPMFALAVLFVRAWRREPVVQHVVFSTHFIAFMLLLFTGIGLVVKLLRALPGAWQAATLHDSNITTVVLLTVGAYLYGATRRAYRDGRATALLRAAALAGALLLVLMAYRLMLFFTVMYSV